MSMFTGAIMHCYLHTQSVDIYVDGGSATFKFSAQVHIYVNLSLHNTCKCHVMKQFSSLKKVQGSVSFFHFG